MCHHRQTGLIAMTSFQCARTSRADVALLCAAALPRKAMPVRGHVVAVLARDSAAAPMADGARCVACCHDCALLVMKSLQYKIHARHEAAAASREVAAALGRAPAACAPAAGMMCHSNYDVMFRTLTASAWLTFPHGQPPGSWHPPASQPCACAAVLTPIGCLCAGTLSSSRRPPGRSCRP